MYNSNLQCNLMMTMRLVNLQIVDEDIFSTIDSLAPSLRGW